MFVGLVLTQKANLFDTADLQHHKFKSWWVVPSSPSNHQKVTFAIHIGTTRRRGSFVPLQLLAPAPKFIFLTNFYKYTLAKKAAFGRHFACSGSQVHIYLLY